MVDIATAPATTRYLAFMHNLLLRAQGKLEANVEFRGRVGIHGLEHVWMHRNTHTCSSNLRRSLATHAKGRAKGLAHTLRLQLSLKGAFIMRNVKRLTFVLAVALFVLASRTARADEFDRLMAYC